MGASLLAVAKSIYYTICYVYGRWRWYLIKWHVEENEYSQFWCFLVSFS